MGKALGRQRRRREDKIQLELSYIYFENGEKIKMAQIKSIDKVWY
jgi:hypothetical protein